MASSDKTVIAFDLYGTLLSTESIAKTLSDLVGADKADSIAASWRRYQLEYTWRLNSMSPTSFPMPQENGTLTLRSLVHALNEQSVTISTASQEDLVGVQYSRLSTFPDVPPALEALSTDSAIHAVVFSNGDNNQLKNTFINSHDLAKYRDAFQGIVSVEEVQRFKPDPEVYLHLARKVGKQTDTQSMGSMWLVSGNPFDVVGAKAVGMKAAWVDRAGKGWVDELMMPNEEMKPDLIVKGLGEVVQGGISNLYTSFATDVIKSHVENNTINAVSRASIERELITQLDRATDLNVDYKIAWYHAILETPLFDSLWYSLSIRHSLPPSATERYTVEASYYEYEVLTKPLTKPRSTKSAAGTKGRSSTSREGPSTSKAPRKPNKAMRYIPSSPAVSGPPPRSSQIPPNERDPSFADASSSSSAVSSSSSSDEDEDGVDEEAAALGRSLYEHAIASTSPPATNTTSAPPTQTSKVIGGAGRLGVGVKTRTPTPSTVAKKAKPAEKVEEPGDGAYIAPAVATNGRGGARKGIDRKAGAKGTKMIRGKGVKFDKGKVVKFAGLDGLNDMGEGKENVEADGRGKRMRVPTEKVMLAMQ
ncbi:MAG: hypothetical protein OHK93_000046 [Ramalina farinacea]|uniref:Haloacid dehalogenase n=1 Tax=Ramalina farinacea TaxID=258253 RepID=A0AA43QFV3_9LECA|nr:hypothetical protein [Ramalina farinacea]